MIQKVGITGTRYGMNSAQEIGLAQEFMSLILEIDEFDELEVHHGCCQGVDAQVHDMARKWKFRIVGHPPIEEFNMATYLTDYAEMREPKDYLDRNQDIVNEVSRLLAFPKGMKEERRSGTWSTIRRARKAKLDHVIFWPDGTFKVKEY